MTDNVQTVTVITLMALLVIDRTMTATFRAAALRRIRQDGGITGETFQTKSLYYHSHNMERTIQYKLRTPKTNSLNHL